MKKQLTLGSLFDGIGGFPLAGQKSGMRPVWASEIEPFPIRVTEERFPDVRHYGDIHKLNGSDLEPVDVITFGSPCQDLSLAGRRVGLEGSRSSLFYEAIRIIQEMRWKTNGRYPRYAVFENVPGALSSNGGRDFQKVLECFIRIKDPEADVPLPENGRWLHAGEIMGDDYSLAWRIIDAAQGWGVAQRRKRIFAVFDLDGTRAGRILFESEGMSGYTPPGGEARQGAAGCAADRAGASGEIILNDQGGSRMDVTVERTATLRASAQHPPCVMEASGFCTEHSADSRGIGYKEEESPTLRAGVVPGVAIEYNPTDSRIKIKEDGVCQTLTARCGTGGNTVPLTFDKRADKRENKHVFGICSDQSNSMLSDNPHSGIYEADTSRTLDRGGGSPCCAQGGMMIVEPKTQDAPKTFCLQGSMIGRKDENGPQGDGINEDVSFTLNTADRHAVYAMTTGSFTHVHQEVASPIMARDFKDAQLVGHDNSETEYIVRRLTPGECCRLQGYPDGWCENLAIDNPNPEEVERWEVIFEDYRQALGLKIKPKTKRQIIRWLQNPYSDSAAYKAYGNSVAVPCVFFVLAGIVWVDENEEVIPVEGVESERLY